MTTLREAAQQALEALGKWSSGRDMDAVELNDLIATLEATLEQPKPPPEAQTEAEKIAYCAGWWAAMEQKREQPEQEPVAWRVILPDGYQFVYDERMLRFIDESIHETRQPLYTHPPRREWRPLSEEEISRAYFASASHTEYARAIEAALKEKNHE